MGFLKKLARGVRKTVGKKLLTKALRIGAGIVTGGQSEVALRGVSKVKSIAKSMGIRTRRARLPKSESAVVAKLAALAPPQLKTTPSAETMPGGAPLKRKLPRLSARARLGVGYDKGFPLGLHQPKLRPKKRVQKAQGGTRSAPKGGKDFKALSASWKAAGKPGKWIDWVKAH